MADNFLASSETIFRPPPPKMIKNLLTNIILFVVSSAVYNIIIHYFVMFILLRILRCNFSKTMQYNAIYYDSMYPLTLVFATLILYSFRHHQQQHQQHLIQGRIFFFLALCWCVWGLRLLVHIIHSCSLSRCSNEMYEDPRFSKPFIMSIPRQAKFVLWNIILVFANGSAVPIIFSSFHYSNYLNAVDVMFIVLSLCGLGIAAVADAQKLALRRGQSCAKSGRRLVPMDTGLWRYSRHANYLGEIMFFWSVSLLVWLRCCCCCCEGGVNEGVRITATLPMIFNFTAVSAFCFLGCTHATLAMLLFAGRFSDCDASVLAIRDAMSKDEENYQNSSERYGLYCQSTSLIVPGCTPSPFTHGVRRAGFGMGCFLVSEGHW